GNPLEIELGPSACAELRKLEHPHDPVWEDKRADAVAWSVGALAFEAVQITGFRDKPAVECHAVQSIPTTAVTLGATPNEGRYFELAEPAVAEAVEALSRVAPQRQVRSLRKATKSELIREARTCYDHLAGRLGVSLAGALERSTVVVRRDGTFELGADAEPRL